MTTPPPAASPAREPRVADLVLEGGGVKGIGLAGAITRLAAGGWSFKRVAGSSAGAIAAALVAALERAGRPLAELQQHVQSIDFPKFMAKSPLRRVLGPVGDAEHLLLHMGIYDGDYLIEWLGGVLAEIGVTRFGDLRVDDPGADANLGADQHYSLIVTTSDISRGKCVRLPWDYREYGHDPDHQRIVDAVRASMSIPFFFEPVRLRAPAVKPYAAGPVTWVDGGLLDNFPVDIFDRTDNAPSRWPTIGIKLSAKQASVPPSPPDGAIGEAVACLHTLLDNADRTYVTPERAQRTIFVDNHGISATKFGLTTGEQQELFDSGTSAADAWLATH